MAVWVDCQSTPSYFGGFAADMGPYIGPWPLLPPGEMSGLDPAHHDEVDFIVALPNPADTTDVTIVGDDSYDTPIWDAYRYFTGTGIETSFGYFGSTTGSTPSVPPTPPAGVHLYMIAYAGSPLVAPPNPPEFYVPASYAAGGAAAFETAMGHWTSDQASYDKARTVFATNLANPSAILSHPVSGSNQNVPVEVDTMIAAILAMPATSTTSTFNEVSAVKDPDGDPQSTTGVGVDVLMIAWDGTSNLALGPGSPPALDPLTYGVDYVDSPYIDADGNDGPDFRFTGSNTWDWGDSTATGPISDSLSKEDFVPLLDAPPNWTLPPDADNTPLGLKTRLAWEPGDTTGSPTWASSGTILGDFAPVAETATGAIFLSPANLVVDYSPITDLAFTLHIAPKFLYDGSVDGLTDFAMPGGGHISSFRDQMVFFPGNPRLLIHSGPWQYWVPGDIVPTTPKWHTVAGSWASISGAPMAIFTPGLGPVDYADGPA